MAAFRTRFEKGPSPSLRGRPRQPQPPASVPSFWGILELEQELEYFPADSANLRVIWNPDLETQLERFLTLEGWLSLSSSFSVSFSVEGAGRGWAAISGTT